MIGARCGCGKRPQPSTFLTWFIPTYLPTSQSARSPKCGSPRSICTSPRDRRIALALGQPLPDRTSGAVLFADVSKFSSPPHHFSKPWAPSVERRKLTRRLNSVLATVVGEVHRYGGSVIGFAGDGATCWFDGDNGRRATAAALAAQEALGEGPPVSVSGSEPSRVKIVVTAGLARRFLVGVPRIQRFDVLAGGILDRMAAAERLAQPGDVLIGSGIVGWIRDQVEIVDWRHDSSQPTSETESFAVVTGIPTKIAEPVEQVAVPALAESVARGWINPALFQRITSGEGELVSELRQAVTLFVRFSGIQYDFDNEAGTKLNSYVEWVQKTLIPLGGYIMQVIVGDKGSYLYAVFGAPLGPGGRFPPGPAGRREPDGPATFSRLHQEHCGRYQPGQNACRRLWSQRPQDLRSLGTGGECGCGPHAESRLGASSGFCVGGRGWCPPIPVQTRRLR